VETIKSRKKLMRGPFWVTNVPEEKKSKLKKISRELKSSPQNEICTYGDRGIQWAILGTVTGVYSGLY